MQRVVASSLVVIASTFDVVQTPHGLRPRACVHRVPSDTLVEALSNGVRHTFPNGTVRTLGQCHEAAAFRTLPPGNRNASIAVAHYPAPVYSTPSSSAAISYFTAKYVVPKAPQRQDDQSIYIWIGTDPDDESDVMQPVLGWNRVGGSDPSGSWYGEGGWGIESWNMVPAGHSTFSDTVWGFQEGDIIDALIQFDSSIGTNGYYISATGPAGQRTALRANGRQSEHVATLQFETWNECADSACQSVVCDRMPASDVILKDVYVTPSVKFYTSSGYRPGDSGLTWDLQDRCGWTKSLTQTSYSLLTSSGDYPWNQCGHLPSGLATPCTAWQDTSCSAEKCKQWAESGACSSNPDYMLKMCMPQCCDVGPGSVAQAWV